MSDPPLKTVSDELIQTDEEKIEVFRSRHAIRITATKAKAQTITQGIRSTLEGVHRIEVPLEPLKALARGTKGPFEGDEFDEFGGPVLAELARLTNSEVVETSKDKVRFAETRIWTWRLTKHSLKSMAWAASQVRACLQVQMSHDDCCFLHLMRPIGQLSIMVTK